jgi:AhpD family alkylhydroperoxidase
MTGRLDYMTTSPEGINALGTVYGHILKSGLPGELVTLVYLRVSQMNGCAYCIDLHSRELLRRGINLDKVVLVPAWRESGRLFDDREQAALAWAETVTRVADTGIPDEEYEAASRAFDARELTDLTIAIGLMNAYNRLGIAFRRPPDALVELEAAADTLEAAQ